MQYLSLFPSIPLHYVFESHHNTNCTKPLAFLHVDYTTVRIVVNYSVNRHSVKRIQRFKRIQCTIEVLSLRVFRPTAPLFIKVNGSLYPNRAVLSSPLFALSYKFKC
jgi:hypothetical protein